MNSLASSLAEQYARNLQQAEQLLERVMDRMAANQVEPRILIFSDHTLRQQMWCANLQAMLGADCSVTVALTDEHVPLIVAARKNTPSIAHVQSNQQVFDVLRHWLNH